jgi:Asp-tRNA(Asn)/Glu-tRNA(Gln) amidotransferase A subunit family amidase
VSANASARALAGAVRKGERSAVEVILETLAAIAARNGAINAFTAVTERRALADAATVDRARQRGRDPGPLAGVPFAVKNLYDIAGLATIAGSRIDRDRVPATHDAGLVRRLAAAGAVLVGALNMDETPSASRPRTPITARRAIRMIRSASPAALPAARRRRLQHRWCPWRSDPTPTDRYACLRRCAACLG